MGNGAEKPSQAGLALRVAGILAAPAAIGFAIDCGGGNDTSPSTPTANVQTSETGMPSATALATKITESPTPASSPESTPTVVETSAPVPCEILPQEYCSQAEFIDWSYQEQPYRLVGFRLPAGVSILSPTDGMVSKNKTGPSTPDLSGSQVVVRDYSKTSSEVPTFDFIGDLIFDNTPQQDVKAGDVITQTQDTGIKMFGKYNVVLLITQMDPATNKSITPEGVLKQYFPSAH